MEKIETWLDYRAFSWPPPFSCGPMAEDPGTLFLPLKLFNIVLVGIMQDFVCTCGAVSLILPKENSFCSTFSHMIFVCPLPRLTGRQPTLYQVI